MLVFRRQSKSTGHKCEGLQIYSTVCQLMSHITTGLKQLSNGSKRNLFVVSIMDLQVMYVNT